MAINSLPVAIHSFSHALASHFYRLNAEWLQRLFSIEPIDQAILSDPFGHIIQPGGAILFAQQGTEVVGTCALKVSHARRRRFELTKMAVTARAQGQGIGRVLLDAALERYRALGGHYLFLETNSQLKPAIRLYESVGFRTQAHPRGGSIYARADVYMVYDSSGTSAIAKGSELPAVRSIANDVKLARR